MSTVAQLAETLLADAQACLVAADRPVKRAVVFVGASTWDECCEGMLYVTVARTFRSESFPAEDVTWRPCGGRSMAVEFQVGVIRCAPMPDDRGNLPTQEAITASSLSVLEDARILLRCLGRWGCEDDLASVLTGQTMLADEGGCIGHETRLLVEFDG